MNCLSGFPLVLHEFVYLLLEACNFLLLLPHYCTELLLYLFLHLYLDHILQLLLGHVLLSTYTSNSSETCQAILEAVWLVIILAIWEESSFDTAIMVELLHYFPFLGEPGHRKFAILPKGLDEVIFELQDMPFVVLDVLVCEFTSREMDAEAVLFFAKEERLLSSCSRTCGDYECLSGAILHVNQAELLITRAKQEWELLAVKARKWLNEVFLYVTALYFLD